MSQAGVGCVKLAAWGAAVAPLEGKANPASTLVSSENCVSGNVANCNAKQPRADCSHRAVLRVRLPFGAETALSIRVRKCIKTRRVFYREWCLLRSNRAE